MRILPFVECTSEIVEHLEARKRQLLEPGFHAFRPLQLRDDTTLGTPQMIHCRHVTSNLELLTTNTLPENIYNQEYGGSNQDEDQDSDISADLQPVICKFRLFFVKLAFCGGRRLIKRQPGNGIAQLDIFSIAVLAAVGFPSAVSIWKDR